MWRHSSPDTTPEAIDEPRSAATDRINSPPPYSPSASFATPKPSVQTQYRERRRSKPTCWAYRRGQCRDVNCPKRHCRSWDPERLKSSAKEDSSDDESDNENEELTVVAKAPSVSKATQPYAPDSVAPSSRGADPVVKSSAVSTIPAIDAAPARSQIVTQPEGSGDEGLDASRPDGSGKKIAKYQDLAQVGVSVFARILRHLRPVQSHYSRIRGPYAEII